ncbi:hypothetical protein VP1G_08958 [Cytospora mali]|uniref:Uncharacterized protein n=1 Tax=Cytospora mali TaxID=578113 RepID=A0A194VDE6_CYTMA|nr:hypothetical protein VP1G_08958 [Valsa mali var. pyri (nom. inval.)]
MLKSQKEVDMPSQGSFMERLRDTSCFNSLMGFFFNKGVRGGPRILLNLASVLLVLLVIAKLMPSRVAESALGSIPHDLWSGISGGSTADDGSVPGGLRIVVFGENDLGTPVGRNEEVEGSKSWTQALCAQLECTNHISMVPSVDTAAWSVSSNELYARGVEKVFNETADKSTPGMDYSYLSTYYPPQWKSPDLRDQIDRFLAMPKPRHAPKETLWIFSFGIWDVWSLSALPNSIGQDLTGAMTKDIFKQIERLYEASTDPMSIAWSDINSVPAENLAADATDGAIDEAPAEGPTEKRDEDADANANATQEGAEEGVDEGPEQEAGQEAEVAVDTFRILIPRIMDPSLLPGWRDLRPVLPKVHSKAEQMRNSAELTGSWNDGIVNCLSDWVKKENKKPDVENNKEEERKESRDIMTEAEGTEPTNSDPALDSSSRAVTYPMRDGFAYNLADYLLDAMIERQMRNARLKDGSGRGDGSVEDGYRDVSNACVQPVNTVAVSVSVESGLTLDIPNRNIGKDIQVPTAPTPRVSRREDARGDDKPEGNAGIGLASQTGSTVKVCQIPSDHLFYTPFALSQRAIEEIASQSADLVRSSDTVRAKLQAQSKQ